MAESLVFEIDTAANTAKLVGSAATPPKGDLSVPASVTSASTAYEVTSIAKNAFAKCPELTSISLPATLREVDSDALSGCSSLTSITVSSKSEAFSARDGMLFSKDYSRLLLIPEGKEGAATIPGQTTYVPAQAFSRCLSSSLTAGDGSAEFKTLNGMLFTKDLKTLVVCPPKVGNAVVLPAETETIGEYALAGCKELTSITALGNVQEIDPTAFADEVMASAVVALPAGKDYDARKAVWEASGFQRFAEPAEPGATSRPEVDNSSEAAESGFVFTLLDDYTLSVAWEGSEDPAADLEIPASAEINDVSYRVSTIAANAFANRSSLTSVKLPESVTSIGEAAFAGCANLTTIQLPDTLSEIGERAFEATALAEVWLPASVQSISSRAFGSCEALTRIVALNTPEVVDDAIAGCANLSLYCPYNADNTYPWNLGLIANNNHLLPYGLTLPEKPLQLEVGQSANLFEGGHAEVPEGCELIYSYAAAPVSIENGFVTGKATGTTTVTVLLSLEDIPLAQGFRPITVEEPKTHKEDEQPKQELQSKNNQLNEAHLLTPASSEAEKLVLIKNETVSLPSSENPLSLYASSDSENYETCEVAFKLQGVSEPFGWETQSTTSINSSGMVTNPGTPILEGFTFTGWCTDENCLQLFDFSQPLPEGVKTLYGKWVKHGGRGTDEGALPVNGNVGSAWWRITADDTLTIDCEGDTWIAGLFSGETDTAEKYWNPYRTLVKKITISPTVRTTFMSYWFQKMPNLEDISEVIIPEGVIGLYGTFLNCTSLVELPKSFKLPESVTDTGGMFQGCSNLKSVPETFKISSNVKTTYHMFRFCSSLVSLPAGFSLPPNLARAENMFDDCKQLQSLPDSFTLPMTITNTSCMFMNCRSLRSLPEGFKLPKSIVFLQGMFKDCASLSILPEGFTIPPDASLDPEKKMNNMFDGCSALTVLPSTFDFPLEAAQNSTNPFMAKEADTLTYFAGPDTSAVRQYDWSSQKRTLVTDSAQAGQALVTLMLPTEVGDTFYSWGTIMVAAGASLDQPMPPKRVDELFVGWYTNESYDTLVEFPLSVSKDMPLYAKYQPLSGSLPTTREGVEGIGQEGSWSFSEEGTLTIDCEPGARLVDLYLYNEENLGKYWNPIRSLVKKAVVRETVRTPFMTYWFRDMPNLTDITEVIIPEGVIGFYGLFMNCTSLANIPESLKLPEGLADTGAMFQSCSKLTLLPDTFKVPSTVKKTQHMFRFCSSLKALPADFRLPENLAQAEYMFDNCQQLKTLPEGFVFPDTLTNASHMFMSNRSLRSLPEGFTIPENIIRIDGLFYGCNSLATLPEGFTIPLTAPLDPTHKMNDMFSGCNSLKVLPNSFDFPLEVAQNSSNPFMVANADTLTYFAGPAQSAVRQYDWSSQKRKLAVPDDPKNPLPDQVHAVSFKVPDVANPAKWVTYIQALTSSDGKVANPGDPARFGYPFQGWYADPDYQASFDFENTVIDSNEVVVYGKFGGPILRFEAPVQATVKIDATGSVSSVSAQARSFTPVEVNVQGLRLDKKFGASQVFDDPSKVSALVQFANELPYTVPLGGGSVVASATVPMSSGYAKPGLLPCSIGMDLGGTTLRYIPDVSTEVATLVWTVSL